MSIEGDCAGDKKMTRQHIESFSLVLVLAAGLCLACCGQHKREEATATSRLEAGKRVPETQAASPAVLAETRVTRLLATSGPTGHDTPTPVGKQKSATVKPTLGSSPSPSSAPADQLSGTKAGAPDLSKLTSYELEQIFYAEYANGDMSGFSMTTDLVRKPYAMRAFLRFQENGEAGLSSEIITIGEDTYCTFGDNIWCISDKSAQDFVEGVDWPLDPFKTLGWCTLNKVGKETVLGEQAMHYRATTPDFSPEAELREGEEVAADLWISTRHDVPIQSEFTYKNIDRGEENPTYISTSSWLLKINEPITITFPSLITNLKLPEDVPLMKGAKFRTNLLHVLVFSIDASPKEVLDYYRGKMPGLGWETMEQLAEDHLTFTKPGYKVRLSADESDGQTTFSLVLQKVK